MIHLLVSNFILTNLPCEWGGEKKKKIVVVVQPKTAISEVQFSSGAGYLHSFTLQTLFPLENFFAPG